MTRTKMLAVVGVVLLVAFAGCGGTDPDNVSQPTDAVGGTDGAVGGETTAGAGTTDGGLGNETTAGEETTEGEMTTEGNMTTGEGTTAGAGGDNGTAAVTFEDQTSNGSAVVLANITLPNGGFVAVHNTTEGGQVGDVLGNTTYLESGTHENLTVTFMNTSISSETELTVMLYEDTNDNQVYDYPAADSPYMADGEPVTDTAMVSVSGAGGNMTTDGGTDSGNTTETTS